jgi:histidinol-phosphate phosphatase family protein
VTNQQGVGKGLMTAMTLEQIHFKMIDAIRAHGGNIDAVYYCPYLSSIQPRCRKPNTGMAEQAKEDFPEINFKKSIMVGDSDSDIEMGNRLDMYSIKINNTLGYNPAEKVKIDLEINALFDLVNYIN